MGRGNWYKKWQDNRGFIIENDMLKNKSYIYNLMPKANQFGFQNGNIRGFVASDVFARFDRLNDLNVLFPIGLDTLSLSSFSEAKRCNNSLDDSIPDIYLHELMELGVGINTNKYINMRHDEYVYMLQEAFIDLYNKGYIVYKNKKLYLDDKNQKIYDDFSKFDNIDYSIIKQKVFTLKFDNLIDDIISDIKLLNIDNKYIDIMLDKFKPRKNLVLDLELSNKNKLEIFLDRPEILGGLSFIVLNPKLMDIETYISQEEKENILDILNNTSNPFAYSGIYAINPLTGRQIPIFISTLYNIEKYLVFPGVFEDDRLLQESMELEYLEIISGNLLINSDFLDGLNLKEARKKIIEVFIEEHVAHEVVSYDNLEINLSSIDTFGLLYPFLYDKDKNMIYSLEKYLPYNFSMQFRPILKNDVELLGQPLKGTINSLFIDGITPFLSILFDVYSSNESLFLSSSKEMIKEWIPISSYIVLESNLISGLLMPIIFYNILKKEFDLKIDILASKIFIVPETKDYTYTTLERKNNNNLDFDSLLKKYYSDSIRLYFLSQDIKEELIYDEKDLELNDKFVKEIKEMLLNATDLISNKNDYYFKDFIVKVKKYLESRDLYNYVSFIKSFSKKYVLKEPINLYQLKMYLIAIYPIMPYLAEEIYEIKFNKKHSLINEGWIL